MFSTNSPQETSTAEAQRQKAVAAAVMRWSALGMSLAILFNLKFDFGTISLVVTAGFLLVLSIFPKKMNERLRGTIGITGIVFLLIAHAAVYGGTEASAVRVLPLLPIAATWVGGRRAGLGMMLLCVAAVEAFVVFEGLGVDFATAAYPALERVLANQLTAFAAVVGFGLATAFENSRQKAESALEDAVEAAQRGKRLAALGTLAAGVAHEINNPLAYISSNLDFIAKRLTKGKGDVSTTTEINDALADSQEGARRIRRIVSAMRSLTRAPGKWTSVDLRPVVSNVQRLTEDLVSTTGEIVVDLAPGPLFVAGSNTLLEQALVNLVTNAVHACGRSERTPKRIRVATGKIDDQWIQVLVEDSGPGIPEENITKIFDPFFTTKEHWKGTGLGLALVHHIANGLGGKVSAQNIDEGGARMTLTLPRTSPETTEVAAQQEAKGLVPMRVAIVDDEVRILRSLSRSLGDQCDVQTFSDSQRALAYLSDPTHPCDLVISDFGMPNLNGFELYSEVRRIRPELDKRFIFVTGGALTPQVAQFIDSTTLSVLEKPVNMAALLKLVDDFGPLQPDPIKA